MTAALVIGFGSIGQRHARLLDGLGCRVAVLSRRPVSGFTAYSDLATALAGHDPDYVVVANETSAHRASLAALAELDFGGKVLVEKPLGRQPGTLPVLPFTAAVAYNLRFHPVLAALHQALAGQSVISCQAYCGQYLPDWRPGTDYRQCYSADPAQGGGVLRDLSHEIDLLLWLFGGCSRLTALGGHLSPLEIASDDCWGMLMELQHCPVATLHINYLDRPGRRDIVVNTATDTFRADLSRGMLVRNGEETALPCGRDDTYLAQHRAMLEGSMNQLCSLEQAEAAMRLIAAAERAAQAGEWVRP
ncbi:MAG: Gfo/Idh/MocA family oxidoreductase [Magnetospirillum sp.]|nr:Gfo/Idh/MocA family oxidoreductase [Magnetospirillum sp.]